MDVLAPFVNGHANGHAPAPELAPDHRTLVNQANASLSTGPRTEEGKAAASRNSFKHGLSGLGFTVLPTEDQEAFNQLHAGFVDHFQPDQPLEHMLVQELTQHYWLSQRAMRMQNLCFHEDGELNDRRLSLALRYLTTHRRLFDQLFEQLTEIAASRAQTGGFVSQMPSEAQIHAMFAMPPMPSASPKAPEPHRPNRRDRRKNRR